MGSQALIAGAGAGTQERQGEPEGTGSKTGAASEGGGNAVNLAGERRKGRRHGRSDKTHAIQYAMMIDQLARYADQERKTPTLYRSREGMDGDGTEVAVAPGIFQQAMTKMLGAKYRDAEFAEKYGDTTGYNKENC
eukprot:g77991.t1